MSRIATTVLLALLRGYKWVLSPMLPPSCRFVPSCSEYAAEAVERHGVLRGSEMAMARLLRCHPFAKGGFDPVPYDGSFALPASRQRLCAHEPSLEHRLPGH